MHICNAKSYMFRNYKLPCLTCVYVQVFIYVFVHACMKVPPHTHNHPQPRGCQITKNAINLELMKIIQFCLKIYVHSGDSPSYGWEYELISGVVSNH